MKSITKYYHPGHCCHFLLFIDFVIICWNTGYLKSNNKEFTIKLNDFHDSQEHLNNKYKIHGKKSLTMPKGNQKSEINKGQTTNAKAKKTHNGPQYAIGKIIKIEQHERNKYHGAKSDCDLDKHNTSVVICDTDIRWRTTKSWWWS